MFSFKKKNRGDRLTALLPGSDGTATATIRQVKNGKPVLESCRYYPLAPGQEPEDNLRAAVHDQVSGKTACTTVLASGDYQLLSVEAPEVPSTELRAAIRWRIRDLIDFHIDDAVLDVFDTPAGGARGIQDHLYVVVAKTSLIKETIDMLENSGAGLEVIDIPELALRNVAAGIETDGRGQALLYFDADHGLVTLTRDDTLYLARGMDIGYRQLQETPEMVDRLALEIQRSLDYYDRHFQQAPIAGITLCPLPEPLPQLAGLLEQQLGIPVRDLKLDEIVQVGEAPDAKQLADCFMAISAALRTEHAEL